jgi:acyl-homoserine lactone synthase
MLTHIVTAETARAYQHELVAMHQMRAELFVRRLKWAELSVNADGEERDQYDDVHTSYMLTLDEAGELVASMRMRQTTDRCMISEHFPHLVADGPDTVRGQEVWEGSRYMLAPHMRGELGVRALHSLHIASLELGLSRGLKRFIGMCDVHFIPGMRRTGWRIKHLGLPARYPEGEAFAFEVEVSQEALSDARDVLGVHGQTSVELPITRDGEKIVQWAKVPNLVEEIEASRGTQHDGRNQAKEINGEPTRKRA